MREAAEAVRSWAAATEVLETQGKGSATELARQAACRGVEVVLACGGDGTVNEVINGLAGSRTALGVLPAGTGNALALELSLPRDPVQAAAAAPRLAARRVALGRVWCEGAAGRYFALVCGAGVDADLMAGAEKLGKQRWGMLAYWLTAASMLGRRLDPVQVTAEGRTWECTLALATRVRRIGGGLRITRRSHLLDDTLEMVTFPSRWAWHYAGYAVEALLGPGREGVVVRQATLSGRCAVEADGEVIGRLPARVEVVTDALTLLMPEEHG